VQLPEFTGLQSVLQRSCPQSRRHFLFKPLSAQGCRCATNIVACCRLMLSFIAKNIYVCILQRFAAVVVLGSALESVDVVAFSQSSMRESTECGFMILTLNLFLCANVNHYDPVHTMPVGGRSEYISISIAS